MRGRGGSRGRGSEGGTGRGGGRAQGGSGPRGRGTGSSGHFGGSRTASAPWSRLKPVELDPLEELGLPSKGDDRLLDFKAQERYYTRIVERYMTFCSDAGERDELLRRFAAVDLNDVDRTPSIPSNSAAGGLRKSATAPAGLNADTKGLSDVLAALRKLREGIVASKRADDFAIQAYLFCIRLTVLVKHPESYHPAILHLLRRIHPLQPMTNVEAGEVVGYLVLDTACRRGDLAEAYSIRHRYQLKDQKIDSALHAMAHDNYVLFQRVKWSVDGHKAKLLEYADANMRGHLLKCFGRTYLSVELAFLEKNTDTKWTSLVGDDGVGWDLDNGTVIIRKVKGK